MDSQVVVVEASAGSGKTYCLAKRYLELLIDPHFQSTSLRDILAITFTNKAAVKMKERILELLKRIVFDSFSTPKQREDILDALGNEKKFIQHKACQIMDELIRHYDFFWVQTIDSFINTLLLGASLHIDRSAHFKIKKDYLVYLAYCLDLVIDEGSRDRKILSYLEEFLKHYLFVENKGGWFPKEDILRFLQALFTLSNRYQGSFEFYPLGIRELIRRKKALREEIKELSSDFPFEMNGNAKRYITDFISQSEPIFDLKNLPSAFRSPLVPMNKGKIASLSFQKKWRKVHKAIKELIELEALTAYNSYIKLFGELEKFLQRVCKKEDILFLEELNRKAQVLFGKGSISIGEVYYRLSTRLKHYLIDEFQDTSILEWRNLHLMIEEALASGGTLFYVGDKKQAIYRFRGGEVRLFDEVKKEFARFGVQGSSLIKNWRSQKAIVEFNNNIFCRQNLWQFLHLSGIAQEIDSELIDDILFIFKDAVQEFDEKNKDGYVKIERINEEKEERDEIIRKKVITLIEDLRKRFKHEDIAILTRDNEEVELLTSFCLEAGIPVESEKTLNILKNSLIREVVAFLKFLSSPIDDLSFATFILGDMFRQLSGLSSEEVSQFLFTVLRQKSCKEMSLYRSFREKYPAFWDEYISELFKTVGFLSTYELVCSIYQRFGLLENFLGEQAFLMRFLELVKIKEEEYVELGQFLSCLDNIPPDELYVNVTHGDAVTIHTIHKSKGLEFPVVILPFLRIDITPQAGGKHTNSYVLDNDTSLGLARITATHRAYSEKLKAIYTDAYWRATVDELNNIYVAFTRAQYELYIFIPQKSGISNNKARYLASENVQQVGERKKYEREEGFKQPSVEISPSQYKDWLTSLKEEFSSSVTLKDREKILRGNILHTILSGIGNLQQVKESVVLQEALQNVGIRFPFIDDFSREEEKVKNLLKKEKMKPFFYIPRGDAFQEIEVVNSSGDTKRIDRLIVKEKEAWVIDYKTGRNQKDKEQIKEYTRLIKDIYSKKKIRAFLIYLDDLEFEEVTNYGTDNYL